MIFPRFRSVLPPTTFLAMRGPSLNFPLPNLGTNLCDTRRSQFDLGTHIRSSSERQGEFVAGPFHSQFGIDTGSTDFLGTHGSRV
jgi:hypothetical protein